MSVEDLKSPDLQSACPLLEVKVARQKYDLKLKIVSTCNIDQIRPRSVIQKSSAQHDLKPTGFCPLATLGDALHGFGGPFHFPEDVLQSRGISVIVTDDQDLSFLGLFRHSQCTIPIGSI